VHNDIKRRMSAINRGYYAIDIYIEASLKKDKKKKTSHYNLHSFVCIRVYDIRLLSKYWKVKYYKTPGFILNTNWFIRAKEKR